MKIGGEHKWLLNLPNIALQDEHLCYSHCLATYSDTNNKVDASSSLTHNVSMVS